MADRLGIPPTDPDEPTATYLYHIPPCSLLQAHPLRTLSVPVHWSAGRDGFHVDSSRCVSVPVLLLSLSSYSVPVLLHCPCPPRPISSSRRPVAIHFALGRFHLIPLPVVVFPLFLYGHSQSSFGRFFVRFFPSSYLLSASIAIVSPTCLLPFLGFFLHFSSFILISFRSRILHCVSCYIRNSTAAKKFAYKKYTEH